MTTSNQNIPAYLATDEFMGSRQITIVVASEIRNYHFMPCLRFFGLTYRLPYCRLDLRACAASQSVRLGGGEGGGGGDKAVCTCPRDHSALYFLQLD